METHFSAPEHLTLAVALRVLRLTSTQPYRDDFCQQVRTHLTILYHIDEQNVGIDTTQKPYERFQRKFCCDTRNILLSLFKNKVNEHILKMLNDEILLFNCSIIKLKWR